MGRAQGGAYIICEIRKRIPRVSDTNVRSGSRAHLPPADETALLVLSFRGLFCFSIDSPPLLPPLQAHRRLASRLCTGCPPSRYRSFRCPSNVQIPVSQLLAACQCMTALVLGIIGACLGSHTNTDGLSSHWQDPGHGHHALASPCPRSNPPANDSRKYFLLRTFARAAVCPDVATRSLPPALNAPIS